MGCINSQPTKIIHSHGIKGTQPVHLDSGDASTKTPQPDPLLIHKDNFHQISIEVHSLKCPPGMVPIVCLTTDSFPITSSVLNLEDTQPTEIRLPIAAASCSDKGRIFCISHINFLSDSYFYSEDTSRLLYNVFLWLTRQAPITTPILLINVIDIYSDAIRSCFETQGFSIQRGDFSYDFASYQIILITSDISLNSPMDYQKLTDFVARGGGLVCFYAPNTLNIASLEAPVNTFLQQFGLAYSYCILNRHNPTRLSVDVPIIFEQISFCHFISLVNEFNSISKRKDVVAAQLDDLVTALRYHVLVSGSKQNKMVNDIYKNAWHYLKNTNYHTPDGICPSVTHCIMAVLIQDICAKLPLESIKASPEVSEFPGETGNVEIGDHALEVRLHEESWISTGLWLPAGHIGEIISGTGIIPGLHVQIGSHTESLLTKQGPWKRWPSVFSSLELTGEVTQIASSFGGIVYIAVSELDEKVERKVRLTFKGFCRHPRAVISKPSVWEQTREFDVPWAEMYSKTLILTLPTKDLERIDNIDLVLDHLDSFVISVSKFMNYTVNRPYRVVFDREIARDDLECEYPVVLLMDDMDGVLFQLEAPSKGLFKLVSLIAVVSIRENYFDSLVEAAIANLVACVVLKEHYSWFEPSLLPELQFPPLFAELWIIHTRINNLLIPSLLEHSQDLNAAVYDSPEDMWIAFVRDLSHEGNCNFSTLLERARPIPLNLSKSLMSLPSIPKSIEINCV